jgi:predicted nucleotidyltransferase
MERPIDRDFVETIEGLLFCIVGYLHPPDRFTAYLKYLPESGGKWSRGYVSYTRVIPFYHVSQVEGTYGFLEAEYPGYLFECPVRNITISSVPVKNVRTYYKPRDRLKSIIEEGSKDDLEHKLFDLVTILSSLSGVNIDKLGVTGSILTSNHSPEFSDMDLTVYGKENSKRLKNTILDMREEHNVIQPFSVAKKKLWSRSRSGRFSLDTRALMEFAERRWNYGIYSDTYFSIHSIRSDDEINETYGDNIYTQQGETDGVAVITDNEESIYLPAIYRVEQLTSDETEIRQIVSYESLFSDMFDPGDRVEYRGILEKVTGKENYFRVVVGGAGSAPSYLKRTY